MRKNNKIINFLLACVLSLCSLNFITGCGPEQEPMNQEQYKITLNVEGKTTTYAVFKGNKFNEPTTKPYKTNYVFEGWYMEDTFINKYDFDIVPNSDLTLYAKFVLEYEIINYNENKLFSNKSSDSVTKLEYFNSGDKDTVLTVNGTGNLNVNIVKKSTGLTVYNKTCNDGTLILDLDLAMKAYYKIIITGEVTSVLIGERVNSTLNTAVVSVEDTLEFENGVSIRKLYAHLSGEYNFSFNYNTGVTVTVTDMEDNLVTGGDWILRVYSIDLVGNNWYKVKIEYSGNDTITNLIDYVNINGQTIYDTYGKITPLADEDDEVYKTIIKPVIGTNIMIIPSSSTRMTSISVYDAERNLLTSVVSEDLDSYFPESVSLQMEVSKDFYYLEVQFSAYSSRELYYFSKATNSTSTRTLNLNESTVVNLGEESMYWYKFTSSTDDRYSFSSGTYAIILDEDFNYLYMTSNKKFELETNDVIYIGIINDPNLTSSSITIMMKDSFAASSTMGEYTYTRSTAYNDVYKIFDSVTRYHKWTFAAANTTITIMDENQDVLTSYTSTSSNDSFLYELTKETKYYVRLKSSIGGDYTYKKAIDVATICTDRTGDSSYDITGEYWTSRKGTPYQSLTKGNGLKMSIPTSGYYTFHAIKSFSNFFLNQHLNINKLYKGDFYILDENNFYGTNVVVEYDGTASPHEYTTQKIWLNAGDIYFVHNPDADFSTSYFWFIKA